MQVSSTNVDLWSISVMTTSFKQTRKTFECTKGNMDALMLLFNETNVNLAHYLVILEGV